GAADLEKPAGRRPRAAKAAVRTEGQGESAGPASEANAPPRATAAKGIKGKNAKVVPSRGDDDVIMQSGRVVAGGTAAESLASAGGTHAEAELPLGAGSASKEAAEPLAKSSLRAFLQGKTAPPAATGSDVRAAQATDPKSAAPAAAKTAIGKAGKAGAA